MAKFCSPLLPAARLPSISASCCLGVQPGDEIFCPTLTFAATCNPVRQMGARPSSLSIAEKGDVEHRSQCPGGRPLKAKARAGKMPRAVMVVRINTGSAPTWTRSGSCVANMRFRSLKTRAQALGATYKGQAAAGTMGSRRSLLTSTGTRSSRQRAEACCVSLQTRRGRRRRRCFWSLQSRELRPRLRSTLEIGVQLPHEQCARCHRPRAVAGAFDTRIEQRRAIAFRYRDAFADVASA